MSRHAGGVRAGLLQGKAWPDPPVFMVATAPKRAKMIRVLSFCTVEVVDTLPARETGNVRSLKRQLVTLHGHPRFRERNMLAGPLLEDHTGLDFPTGVQLVVLAHSTMTPRTPGLSRLSSIVHRINCSPGCQHCPGNSKSVIFQKRAPLSSMRDLLPPATL